MKITCIYFIIKTNMFRSLNRNPSCQVKYANYYTEQLIEDNKLSEYNLTYKNFLQHKFLKKLKSKIEEMPKCYGGYCNHSICK